MEFLIVIAIIAGLIAGYFCLGMLLKLLLQWWLPLIFAVPLIMLAVGFGWLGALGAVIGALALLAATQHWQASSAYLALEARIDKAFYFNDV